MSILGRWFEKIAFNGFKVLLSYEIIIIPKSLSFEMMNIPHLKISYESYKNLID
jgi:hypothetical protein